MLTQIIQTNHSRPGMIVAKDIYTYNNLLIISKGTVLDDRIITRLKFYSIYELTIDISTKSSPVIATEPKKKITNNNLTYSQSIKNTMEFKQFNSTFQNTVEKFSKNFDGIVLNSTEIDCNDLMKHCDHLLSNSRNKLHLFDMLHCIKNYDDSTYVHSINVALICNTLGYWLNYTEKDIEILTLCGLLHDIGKLVLPTALINKPTKLTDNEYSTIKKHTLKGYQILKDKDIDERIKYAALLHHERCDGSGYPNGFTGAHINDFSKIVAIADVYDAMTSPRIYRGSLCPFEVINTFENEGFSKYDPKFVIPFLNGIIQTYLHNTVHLSNGMKGEIIMINKHNLSKPVVKVEKSFIDLSKETDLYITNIL